MTKNMAASVRQRLLDFPTPSIRAYQFETVIVEKFEAMVKLGMSNSRMKDFYDIYVLAREFEFDGETLQTSIRRTFKRGETPLSEGLPVVWTEQFLDDGTKEKQWRAFLRKSKLESMSFAAVVTAVRNFLGPVWDAIQSRVAFRGTWDGAKWQ